MALNPNIILGAGRGVQQIDTPLEMEAKRATLAQVRQKALDDQQARQADAAFRQALQATGGDYDAAIQQSEQRGFNMLSTRESVQKYRNGMLDSVKKGLENEKVRSDLLGRIMPNVHSQEDWNNLAPIAAAIDPEFVQHAGRTFDEQKFAPFRNLGVEADKQLEAAQKSLDHYYKGDGESAFRNALLTTNDDEDVAGAVKIAKAYGLSDAIIRKYTPDGKWSPELVQRVSQLTITPKEQAELSDKRADNALNQAREERMAGAQQQQLGMERQRLGLEGARVGMERQRLAQGGPAPAGGQSDVKETILGMKDGTLPPVMPGRGSKEYVALMAEAHRQHFDLGKANEDWTATQKYLSTLNGAQQTRLRQATQQVTEMVPAIRAMVKEWDSYGIPGLSYANLQAAKAGVHGNKAQSLANRMEGQIADLTSDLATVYKGGNSSTDDSLALAAKNLQGHWSKQSALDALDQIETNIGYRKNSMRLPPVTGRDENAYNPPNLNQGGPSTSSGPAVGTKRTVNGTTYTWDGKGWLK